jgi:dTDP-4-dehydrorhamnose reductase
MALRRRVLVLGGSGWLGRAVVPAFAQRFDAWAPPHRQLDVCDEASVSGAIAEFRADTVVNLAALNGGEPQAMERVNALGAAAVALAARAAGARLVHMSTDLVLDGRAAPYRDDAPARPVNAYGRSKAAGEDAVRTADPTALLLRTSLVFDPGVPDRFTHSVLERIARGEPAAVFVDEVRCPISRQALAAALAELTDRPEVSGMLNVAGAQPITRADLALRLLRRFGAERLDLVSEARAADAPEPRPLDLTLDVSRARTLLRSPLPTVDEELGVVAPA